MLTMGEQQGFWATVAHAPRYVSHSSYAGVSTDLKIEMSYPADLSAGNILLAIAFAIGGDWTYTDWWDGNYIDAPAGWTVLYAPTAGGRAEFDRFESTDVIAGVWYRIVPTGGLSGIQYFPLDVDATGVTNRVYWVMVQLTQPRFIEGAPDVVIEKYFNDTGESWVAAPPSTHYTPVLWEETKSNFARLEILAATEFMAIDAFCIDAWEDPAGYIELFESSASPSGLADTFWCGYRRREAGVIPEASGRQYVAPIGCSTYPYGGYCGGWMALRILV